MPIPSQDKLVDYLETTQSPEEMPDTVIQPIPDDILKPKFRSKVVTPRQGIEKSRRNLAELEQLTGQRLNIKL